MAEVKQGIVVVVTRNGSGDWWRFPSYKDAFESPIFQYGDAICQGPQFIEKNWTGLEFPWLLEVLVSPVERSRILMNVKEKGWNTWAKVLDHYRDFLWAKMVEKCNEPPVDLNAIFEIVVSDRRTPNKDVRTMAKNPASNPNTPATTDQIEDTSTENTAADATTATGDATEAGTTKRKPPVREPKFKNEMIVTLLADKDGNVFGKDNNPKRKGSASAARFDHYTNGMTVEQALAAGLTRADLEFDVQKKFISIA